MIKSLILTALLSGVGANATPLLNNKAETKETEQAITYKNYENSSSATQQSAEIEWNTGINSWTSRPQNIGWTSNDTSDTQDLNINNKFEAQSDTNVVNIRAYTYENITCRRYKPGFPQGNTDGTGWLMQTHTEGNTGSIGENKSTSLYVMQYQAYQNVTSNQVKVKLSSTIRAYYFTYRTQTLPEGTYMTRIEYKYNMVSTTNNEAGSSFVDMTMTENATSNYDKFNTLNNPTGNYSFNRQIQTTEIDAGTIFGDQGTNEILPSDSPIKNNIEIEFDIPVDPKLINYFICLRTCTTKLYRYNEQGAAVDVSEYLKTDNTPYINYLGCTDSNINTGAGQTQPITSTAANLNTTNVKSSWRQDHVIQYFFTGTYVPPIQTEVVDIPGLMFSVIGMPFTFISTAFNLTLFPGTPYQFNISSVFLMILGILIFIFVLRMILKVFK